MKKRILLLVGIFGAAIVGASFNFGGERASATIPYTNERVSVDASGNQVTDYTYSSSATPAISNDARFVAFRTGSSQLVAGDTNGLADIFVKDRQTSTIIRANTDSSGAQMSTGEILSDFDISDNGRFVVFDAYQPGLVPSYTGTDRDIYVKDLQTGAVEVISLPISGTYANGDSSSVSISTDGRYVAFLSEATNLVSGDTNGVRDVFIRDRALNITTMLSKSSSGTISNGSSSRPTMSCDGAYVAFSSSGNILVTGDTNGFPDMFIVDRVGSTIKNITASGNGIVAASDYPHLSCDGSTLVF